MVLISLQERKLVIKINYIDLCFIHYDYDYDDDDDDDDYDYDDDDDDDRFS